MIELCGSREQITDAIARAGGEIDDTGCITVLGSATRHRVEFTAVGANLYTTDREFAALVMDQMPTA